MENKQCPGVRDENPHLRENGTFCSQCGFPLKLIGDKYELQKLIGEGGFGLIYLAMNHEIEALCVVKILKRKIWKNKRRRHLIRRFKQEIDALNILNGSEHIVEIHDAGYDKDLGDYYVMEYLEGETLETILENKETLPFSQILHIFEQLCKGLSFAHNEGIIHRDLKPENILLIKKKDSLSVKIIDFGIAKILQNTTQLTNNEILGTHYYISPEQCDNQEVDNRTDIYALGCIFYHLLTGTFVFQETSPARLLIAHMMHIPEPMRNRNPNANFPEGMNETIMKALEKDPANRYQSVDDFFNALQPFIDETSSADVITLTKHLDEGSRALLRSVRAARKKQGKRLEKA